MVIISIIEVGWLLIAIFFLLLRLWTVFARLGLNRNMTSFPDECPSAHIDGCTRVTLNDGCNREFELRDNMDIVYSVQST